MSKPLIAILLEELEAPGRELDSREQEILMTLREAAPGLAKAHAAMLSARAKETKLRDEIRDVDNGMERLRAAVVKLKMLLDHHRKGTRQAATVLDELERPVRSYAKEVDAIKLRKERERKARDEAERKVQEAARIESEILAANAAQTPPAPAPVQYEKPKAPPVKEDAVAPEDAVALARKLAEEAEAKEAALREEREKAERERIDAAHESARAEIERLKPPAKPEPEAQPTPTA